MTEFRRLRRIVVKEELVELTGHWLKALILNQFIYWTERSRYVDQYLAEEAARAVAHGDNDDVLSALKAPVTEGWVYKTADELKEELLDVAGRHTIRKHCAELVEAGLLMERSNPKYNWDRTKQYRVDLVLLAGRLAPLGYVLDGFTVLPPERTDLTDRTDKSDRLNGEDRPSNTKRLQQETTRLSANADSRAGRRRSAVTGKHPAILAWRSVTGRYPHRDQYAYVAARLGDEPNIPALEYVTELWRAHDYNPMNAAGQCEWYVLAMMSGDPLSWQPDTGRRSGAVSAELERAWALVGAEVERGGLRHNPEFTDPAIRAAVDSVGWAAICQLPDEEGKRRFAEAFRPAAASPPPQIEADISSVLGAFTS